MRIRIIISTSCAVLAAVGVAVTTAAAAPAAATSAAAARPGAAAAGAGTRGAATSHAATSQAAAAPGYRMACPPARPGQARCYAMWAPQTPVNRAIAAGRTGSAATPAGWGAKDIEAAYKLPVARNPHQTVAVVDAYSTPHLASYLATYRKEYGLPPCTAASGCFREVNEQGTASLPPSGEGTGWDLETTLDVDMASAACPECRILVIEASSQNLTDLATAENTAARLGANAISNSYGAREDGYAMTLAGAYNHPGHAIVVSSGDSGFTSASFPANLDTVTAVGGTELARAKNTRGWAEQVWNAGGGAGGSGCSAYVPKPRWQHDPHCSMRTIADVSAVAWNIPIYDAFYGGWGLVGGTSAASPLIAGVYALAGNAAKTAAGFEYSHAGSLFDITAGNNDLFAGTGAQCGGDYLCVAKKGYDAPTGLGTPNGTGAF
ncbi:MAG: S8 family serine peptidase [Streptosporangiaceae bacterium]|nr:S8 family serine peptidase [Streptosporangiaceae bacterium]